MKLPCRVAGHPAMVVGYGPVRKGRIQAIVITQGVLKAVRLKDLELVNLPIELGQPLRAVVPLKKAER